MYRLFAGFILAVLFCALAFGGPPPRLEISAPTASSDGLFHGRFPHGDAPSPGGACPQTSGPLTLSVSEPRNSGISPLLVFFDATATTDTAITGNATVFQDVTFTWNFGDGGASGTGTWANGSNPGHNSRNTATGGVASHLYITQGSDTTYPVTVTATDGANTVTCTIGALVSVTAFDPSGSNGFAGTKTTCVSSSGTPVPGSGGCPVGAAAIHSTSFVTSLSGSLSNKRVLFKCGDTFTGDNATLSGTKWSVGAYGGCENTQTNRPIINDSGTTGQFTPVGGGDGRIADLDFEGNGTAGFAVQTAGGVITYQMTLYNLLSNGNSASYAYSQGAQWGLIGLVQANAKQIATFLNYGENNPPYSGNVFNNLDFAALMGSFLNGSGPTPGNTNGIETVRISSCRLCVIANNTIQNANGVGAVLKFHEGNTNNSCSTQGTLPSQCAPPCVVGTNIDGHGNHQGAIFTTTSCFVGTFTELIEVSDNLFTGNSGSNLVEFTPQNSGADERMRLAVVERNFFTSATGPADGRDLLVSAVNATVRDNIFFVPSSHPNAPFAGVQVAQRGVEPVPQFVEAYNNTCYFLSASQTSEYCAGFDGVNFSAPGINSFAKNNLFFTAGNGRNSVNDVGTGNAVSNNTVTFTANPNITNGSGTFSLISDFKPTANFSGALNGVPVFFDALGNSWSPTWDLGAVHH